MNEPESNCIWLERVVQKCLKTIERRALKGCRYCFLVATLSAALGYLGISFFLRFPINEASDLAAWVQAFGSIGAIGVAIFVMNKQLTEQRDIFQTEIQNQKNIIEEEFERRQREREEEERKKLRDGMKLLAMKFGLFSAIHSRVTVLMENIREENRPAIGDYDFISIGAFNLIDFREWNDNLQSIDPNWVLMLETEVANNLTRTVELVYQLLNVGRMVEINGQINVYYRSIYGLLSSSSYLVDAISRFNQVDQQ